MMYGAERCVKHREREDTWNRENAWKSEEMWNREMSERENAWNKKTNGEGINTARTRGCVSTSRNRGPGTGDVSMGRGYENGQTNYCIALGLKQDENHSLHDRGKVCRSMMQEVGLPISQTQIQCSFVTNNSQQLSSHSHNFNSWTSNFILSLFFFLSDSSLKHAVATDARCVCFSKVSHFSSSKTLTPFSSGRPRLGSSMCSFFQYRRFMWTS